MFWTNVRKTLAYLRRNGLSDTFYAARERLREGRKTPYVYIPQGEEAWSGQRREYEALLGEGKLPLISLLVPACHPNPAYLRQMLESVTAQSFGNWEVVLADASGDSVSEEIVRDLGDERIRLVKLSENGGISANTNAAADAARGDYVALLDYDDLLTDDCLCLVTRALLREGCDVLYTDEDKCDGEVSVFFEPNHKPDFDPDYLLSNNYICHLLVVKRELFVSVRERSAFDGAQDYDLLLRLPWERIGHVDRVCYHWRTHSASTAGNPGSKSYAYEAGRAALQEYCGRRGMDADVVHSRHRGFYRIEYRPDIFACRPEVGAVGGKLIDSRGRIAGGWMEEDGTVRFRGMHHRESGTMHRADSPASAAALDIRCMEVRDDLTPLLEEARARARKSGDPVSESLRLCRRLRDAGWCLVWDPATERRI